MQEWNLVIAVTADAMAPNGAKPSGISRHNADGIIKMQFLPSSYVNKNSIQPLQTWWDNGTYTPGGHNKHYYPGTLCLSQSLQVICKCMWFEDQGPIDESKGPWFSNQQFNARKT